MNECGITRVQNKNYVLHRTERPIGKYSDSVSATVEAVGNGGGWRRQRRRNSEAPWMTKGASRLRNRRHGLRGDPQGQGGNKA